MQLSELNARVEEATVAKARAHQETQDVQIQIGDLTKEFREAQKKLQDIDRQLAQRTARLNLLKQLAEKFEGFGEGAKAILQGRQTIKESNDPTPDRDAMKMTPNATTLRPNSRNAEGVFSNPNAMPPNAPDNQVQDLGPALVKQGDVPPSAKAAAAVGKDTSSSSQSRKGTVPSEKVKKQEEVMEEEVEISEELESFIKEMLEQGLSEEEIAQAIEENFELVSEESHDKEDDEMEDKKAMKEQIQVDMSEHIEALLAGENLSEEFKDKATAIFEAAVSVKLEEEVAKIQEAYAQTLEEEVERIKAELSENVDDYLNYVVENWMLENEVAIEAGLRTELTEDFISGLRNLFAENYIDIPEDKVSVVEELGSKVEHLEAKLNEEIERNVHLNSLITESKQSEIVSAICEGLTSTQAEKLKRLSEGVEFTSPEHYATKIQTLRENYFHNNVTTNNVLDSVDTVHEDGKFLREELTGPMAAYVRTIGKKLPN
jgi:AcrR family transcriptional regulator